jgi:hypothetical protein
MTKRLQTATWDLTLSASAATLIGTYTADADREIKVNCIARDKGVSGDTFYPYLSVTRPTYPESIILLSGSVGNYGFSESLDPAVGNSTVYQFSSSGSNYALLKFAVPILVYTGDVVKFYLGDANGVECEGYVEFFGTETPTELLEGIVEGALTLKNVLRLCLAVLTGKASGGGTASIKFRDISDGMDRVSMTVDSVGNRSAVTVDGSDVS